VVSEAADAFAAPRTELAPDEICRKIMHEAPNLTRIKLSERSGLALQMNSQLAAIVETYVAATVVEASEMIAAGLRSIGQDSRER